jgi:hypothetical protein
MTDKITTTELEIIFLRPYVPIEAVKLMMDWTGTIDELRAKLRKIADEQFRRTLYAYSSLRQKAETPETSG